MAVKKAAKKGVTNRNITHTITNKIRNVNTRDWFYVSPKDNMWTVRKDGATRAIHVYRQKTTAVNAAIRLAHDFQDSSKIIVYNLQGEISKIIK